MNEEAGARDTASRLAKIDDRLTRLEQQTANQPSNRWQATELGGELFYVNKATGTRGPVVGRT